MAVCSTVMDHDRQERSSSPGARSILYQANTVTPNIFVIQPSPKSVIEQQI